jgi:hypothetical protein
MPPGAPPPAAGLDDEDDFADFESAAEPVERASMPPAPPPLTPPQKAGKTTATEIEPQRDTAASEDAWADSGADDDWADFGKFEGEGGGAAAAAAPPPVPDGAGDGAGRSLTMVEELERKSKTGKSSPINPSRSSARAPSSNTTTLRSSITGKGAK